MSLKMSHFAFPKYKKIILQEILKDQNEIKCALRSRHIPLYPVSLQQMFFRNLSYLIISKYFVMAKKKGTLLLSSKICRLCMINFYTFILIGK